MKKIFTLSIILACSFSIFANDNITSLSITSARNINLVVVDGRSYTVRNNDHNFTLRNLRQGYHSIKVYRSYSDYRNPSQAQRLLYEGRIYARSGYHTEIMINSFGKAYTDAQRIVAGYGDDLPYYATGTHYDHRIIDNNAFQQLKATLQKEKFDQTRVAIAKQAMTMNHFESDQVKELLQLFSFENSKLELAKLFYDVTADKRNFTTVYDVFSFSSSKDELARYLSTKNTDPDFY